MLVIGKAINLAKKYFSHNWWAIVYFNFKMLPFRQAIRFPFDFYYKVRFENLSGRVTLEADDIYRGMIKIGGRGSEMFSRSESIIDIRGEMLFTGSCELGHGILIRVDDGACIKFGSRVRLGALTKLFSKKKIIFGNEIDFSWECQIFDTNFHYIKNTLTNEILARDGCIEIGDRNWFGNRVNVMKGCRTARNTVVASNSLCNKDYTEQGEGVMFGGMPAKPLKHEIERLFEGVDYIPEDLKL
jgi:acetyltransferase-like isoleucine patch superfamily enzyme